MSSKYLHSEQDGFLGHQIVYKFPNGYGVSVVHITMEPFVSCYSPRLYEVAVIYFVDDNTFELCYDTGLTEDVKRFPSMDYVEGFAIDVAGLPRKKKTPTELYGEFTKGDQDVQ